LIRGITDAADDAGSEDEWGEAAANGSDEVAARWLSASSFQRIGEWFCAKGHEPGGVTTDMLRIHRIRSYPIISYQLRLIKTKMTLSSRGHSHCHSATSHQQTAATAPPPRLAKSAATVQIAVEAMNGEDDDEEKELSSFSDSEFETGGMAMTPRKRRWIPVIPVRARKKLRSNRRCGACKYENKLYRSDRQPCSDAARV